VDTPNQRFAVTHVPLGDVAHLGEVVVPQAGRAGAPVRLSDVAVLEEGHPVPIGDAVIGEGPGLLLIVEKQPWANTLAVTREVERALAAEAPALAGVTVDSGIFRPATFIERALTNLERSLAIGCALVVIILFAFLYDLRTALVSVVAIPLSLVGAAAVLSASGATLDTMTVAGLVIALGEVVDDAIIDVENILRRLALERLAARPRPAFTVVLEASLEVRSAVVYATLVVVLVFVPVYFMEGLAGAFFRPLAVSYVLAVLVSLGVALLVTPALSLWLLPPVAGKTREGPLARVVRERYAAIVARAVRRPKTSGAVFGVALVFAGATLPFLGESFLPDFHETDFLMHWVGQTRNLD
jgi:Cu/Ag efflux pump CusA